MKKKLIILIFSLLFVSCQKDSILVAEGDKSIVCQVSVMDANDTKSMKVSKDSLKKYGFRMDAWLEAENRDKRSDLWPQLKENPHYIKDVMMSYSSDQWKSSVDTVKWTNQIWTNFWAQYPYSAAGRGELTWPADPKDITDDQEKTPSFTYDMSAYAGEEYAGKAAEVTPDLLVAYSRVKYDVDSNTFQPSRGVYLTFAHVLSAIRFKAGQTTLGYNIDSIKITGIFTKGTCQLSVPSDSSKSESSVSASWTDLVFSSDSYFSQILNDEYYGNINQYIFLIPQILTSNAKMTAFVSAVGSGALPEKAGKKDVSIEGWTWKPGCKYEYTLNFDPDKHFLTVTVDETNGIYQVDEGLWN